MMKNSIVIFCLCFLIHSFIGCGAISYHKKSEEEWTRAIATTRKQLEDEYVGKSKDTLLQDFGEPRGISYNQWLHGESYEEKWYYNFSEGFLKEFNSQSAKAVWFYINNDKVLAVSVW